LLSEEMGVNAIHRVKGVKQDGQAPLSLSDGWSSYEGNLKTNHRRTTDDENSPQFCLFSKNIL